MHHGKKGNLPRRSGHEDADLRLQCPRRIPWSHVKTEYELDRRRKFQGSFVSHHQSTCTTLFRRLEDQPNGALGKSKNPAQTGFCSHPRTEEEERANDSQAGTSSGTQTPSVLKSSRS